jgi:hypothetical protein
MVWGADAETTLLPLEWNLETRAADVVLDGIARGELPRALLAWMSLMKKGNDPDTIRRWLEIANQESDPQRKADYALVVVFADLTGGTEVWEKALEGFNVIESVTVNKWKAQAAAKAKIEDVIGILEDKFGPVPVDAKAKIEATTSLDILQRWVILAGKATSLDEFRKDAGV